MSFLSLVDLYNAKFFFKTHYDQKYFESYDMEYAFTFNIKIISL